MNDDPTKPIHLTEEGKQQIQEAAEKLKPINFELIFASEFPRTQETAKIINKYHNVEIKIDKRLNDVMSGFEGKPTLEWEEAMKEDRAHTKANGGESFQDVKTRMISFIEDIKKLDNKIILVVSHGNSISAIRGYLKNMSDEETLSIPVHTAEILKLEL